MDAETLKRAVEPFYTTKGVGRGTGLGFSMVHGLAAQSGGALTLESTSGRGTTATIYLPVAAGTALPMQTGQADEPIQMAPLSVLLVDDEELVRIGTADMLEAMEHRVIQAGTGSAALQQLRTEPDIDVIVTDYRMPGMTGVALVSEARRARPSLPAVLVTDCANLDTTTACCGSRSRSGPR